MLAKANKALGVGAGGPGGRGAGFGSMSKRFDGKDDAAMGNLGGPSAMPQISTGNEDEDRRIQAFFEQSGDQWERTQEDMSM